MKITLTGEPLSTQHAYTTTCKNGKLQRFLNKKAAERLDQYMWEAKSQWGAEPIEDEVVLNVFLYFKSTGKRDIDNYFKLVLDACEGIVYHDDSQITELTVMKFHDKSNPRIEIEIP